MIHGGSIIETEEQETWVVANHGEVHVRVCTRCGQKFFSPQLKSEQCYGCWYATYMETAEKNYEDVFAALRLLGNVEVALDQTGGMCLAIHVQHVDLPGHYFWLTDAGGELSPEPDPDDGWTLGFYSHDEDSDGTALPIHGGDEYLSDAVKNTDTAVAIVQRGIEAAKKFKEAS